MIGRCSDEWEVAGGGFLSLMATRFSNMWDLRQQLSNRRPGFQVQFWEMSPGQYKLDIPTLRHKFYRNYTPFWKDRTIIAFYSNWIIFSPTLLYIQERKDDTKKTNSTWNSVTKNYQQRLVFLKLLANKQFSQWMSHLTDNIHLYITKSTDQSVPWLHKHESR